MKIVASTLAEVIPSEKSRIEADFSELQNKLKQRGQLRSAHDAASTRRNNASARMQRLRDDPQALLETSEPDYFEAGSEEREALREETRTQNELRKCEQANPEIDVRGAELERDQRNIELAQELVDLAPLITETIRTGDAHAAAASKLRGALVPILGKVSTTAQPLGSARIPSHQQLRDLIWPDGIITRPPRLADGRDLTSCWDYIRRAVGIAFPHLLQTDDPALGPAPALSPKIAEVIWQ